MAIVYKCSEDDKMMLQWVSTICSLPSVKNTDIHKISRLQIKKLLRGEHIELQNWKMIQVVVFDYFTHVSKITPKKNPSGGQENVLYQAKKLYSWALDMGLNLGIVGAVDKEVRDITSKIGLKKG